jgi:hypothetical protein
LVFVNCAIAIWGLFLRPDSLVGQVVPADELHFVRTMAEYPVDSEANKGPELCELVGPFDDIVLAGDFVERLSSIDIRAELKELELSVGQSYWVYLAPLDSDREAHKVLGELQVKHVESYIVRKGRLTNSISLGMYTRELLAEARLREVALLGYEPVKEVIERKQIELWVMLLEGEGEKMSVFTWEKMLNGINFKERRQNLCLDLASSENIH